MIHARVTGLGLACLLLWLAGCAGYRPVAAEHTMRIALAPVISQSGVPLLIGPLSRQLREGLLHAHGWELVPVERAEAVLHVEVLGLEREATARDPSDTGRPLSTYETLRIALRWESEQAPPWGAEPRIILEADALIYAQPGLLAAESVSLTEMAEVLARKIIEQINWPQPGPRP